MKKLNTTFLAGALAGVLLPGLAAAQGTRELGAARAFEIQLATMNDLAPTRTGEDGIKRLRKTDEEFTNEQGAVKFSPDGKRAVLVRMQTSELNPGTANASLPQNRMQCAVTALETYQEADGSVAVRRPTSASLDKWLTNNRGNEYRNCNKPEVIVINGGKNVAIEYNYQPQGTNDTKRYVKVLDWDLNPVPIRNANGQLQDQVVVMAKNNDDCSMHQSGSGQTGIPYHDENGTTRIISGNGCNGNGRDDAWAAATEYKCNLDAAGKATECTVKRLFDLSVEPREERSRLRCTVGGTDKSFALCTWTAGNTQPQRDGVWMGAIDLSPNAQNGENAQSRLLWKERVAHRLNVQINGEQREYYAMRMQQARIMTKAADGSLVPSDDVMIEFTNNRGNNQNDKKGGRSDLISFGVVKASRTGYDMVMPVTTINMGTSPMMLGLDGTHLSMAEAVFGKGDQLIPGFTQTQGSQTGGLQQDADIRTIGFDPVTKQLVNLGQHSANASYDRHLYSNYLGNNPGNQGRNFAGIDLVKNPFVGQNGNQVQYFQALALTGKAPQHVDSGIKPSVYLSLFPVAFTADAPDPGAGYNDDLPGDTTPDAPAPQEPDPVVTGPSDPGTSVGGCSTSGAPASGGLLVFGLGLAVGLRRRRRN